MIRIIISLLVSVSAICGTITNTANSDQLILSLDSETKQLVAQKLDNKGSVEIKIKLTTANENISSQSDLLRYDETFGSEIFTAPFKVTEIIAKDAYKEKQFQVFFFLPLATALDVVFFPVTIPSYLIKKSYVKKDVSILNEAINSDKTIQVNKRRFKRIIKLLSV